MIGLLKISPLFGALWSTLIMLLYASLESHLKITDIGVLLRIFPFLFAFFSIMSYVFFYIVKFIFMKNEPQTHFLKMWRLFFVMFFSSFIALSVAFLSYYFESNFTKSIFVFVAFFGLITLTYTFHISLSKELKKITIH